MAFLERIALILFIAMASVFFYQMVAGWLRRRREGREGFDEEDFEDEAIGGWIRIGENNVTVSRNTLALLMFAGNILVDNDPDKIDHHLTPDAVHKVRRGLNDVISGISWEIHCAGEHPGFWMENAVQKSCYEWHAAVDEGFDPTMTVRGVGHGVFGESEGE